MSDERGQSTLEYLLVLCAFVTAVGALGLMWHAARDGVLLDKAAAAAPHGMEGGVVSVLKDAVEF